MYWTTNASIGTFINDSFVNLSQSVRDTKALLTRTNSSLHNTNAIAISALTEVNVLLASLGLAYAVNEAGQGVLSSLPQETNQSDIVCNTLRAFTDYK